MSAMNWKRTIVELQQVNQEINDADPKRLFPLFLPRRAATESELANREANIGERLDDRYRLFLRHAGGWPHFYQSVDLFGPREWDGEGAAQAAHELLHLLDVEGTLALSGVRESDVFPIAATAEDMDLFVMGRRHSEVAGRVIWYASYEIDRFESFDVFFLSMMDYQRKTLHELRNA